MNRTELCVPTEKNYGKVLFVLVYFDGLLPSTSKMSGRTGVTANIVQVWEHPIAVNYSFDHRR